MDIERDAELPGVEHVDVLIIGAGLSGIGAAWRLQERRPGTRYAVLEARAAIGGTWDTFRYPGVRSDTDMLSLSYPFRPWRGETRLASGEAIRRYLVQTADEAGITDRIRFRTRVVDASWSSSTARWTVRVEVGEARTPGTWTCSFLYACCGYYDHDRGHRPDFPGSADFAGRFVHPQFWPADLDHAGRRVVVIGSGATAVTLVPALARTAARVTMLQRSPSYVLALPDRDPAAAALHRALPRQRADRLLRARNILLAEGLYRLSRSRPRTVAAMVRRQAERFLDPVTLDRHFTPDYQPWDQRLCLVPDGDLFRAIASGAAEVVTDRIDRFVEAGIRLASGRVLAADVVVCATGLSLLPIGGLRLSVDGTPVELPETLVYRGVLLGGVPNFAFCLGYPNASWTLRADLSSRYVCRLLAHLDRHGHAAVTPVPPAGGGRDPLIGLRSGYVLRGLDRFPRRGTRGPWALGRSYLPDRLADRLDAFRLDRRGLTFTRPARTRPSPTQEVAS